MMTQANLLLPERPLDAQGQVADLTQILTELCPNRAWPAGLSATGLIQLCAHNESQCPTLSALHRLFCALLRAPQSPALDRAEAVDRMLASELAFAGEEQLVMLPLDGSGRALKWQVLAYGEIDRCTLPLRAMTHHLLSLGVRRFILVHNHPSGDAKPSLEDLRLSQLVLTALAGLGICLVDHLVIARSGYASALHGGGVQKRGWLNINP